MRESTVISDNALDYMESNTIDYVDTWRLIERSTLMEYYLTGLSYAHLYSKALVPSGNHLIASTGKDINIPVLEQLFMFPTTKKLYGDEESLIKKVPCVESLYERGYGKKRSFQVYVNGIKIADKRVFVYAYPGGTDLFIPSKVFSVSQDNTLVCTVHDYSDASYANFYETQKSNYTISDFPIPSCITDFNENHVSVYANGKYINHTNLSITTIDRTFSMEINPSAVASGFYDCEIIIDGTIIGRYDTNYINSSKDLFMYIPHDASALIETSVFLHMCNMYIDGIRISMQDMLQKSYRHFLYKRPLNPQYKLTYDTEIVVSDRNKLEEEFAHYIDSFMEFEMWNTEDNILRSLSNDEVGNPPIAINPPFIDYTTMQFPPNNKYIIDSNVTLMMSNEQRACKMIEENSHYFISLLSYYAATEERYLINRGEIEDDSGTMVRITLDDDDEDELTKDTRFLEFYVNDVKILNNHIIQTTQYGKDIAKIPITYFRQNETDVLKLYRYHANNSRPMHCSFNTGTYDWLHSDIPEWVKVESIPGYSGSLGVYELNELAVFVMTDKDVDTDHYFVDVEGGLIYYGMVPNNPHNYALKEVYDETNTKKLYIRIPHGSIINSNTQVIISNPKFHMSKQYILGNMGVDSEYRILLNPVESGVIIPIIIGNYLIKIYCNGQILLPDIDYFILTPQTYERITNSLIMFKRRMKSTDTIEIVYTGITNEFVSGYVSIPSTNKYGFIYFDKLKIPFSLDYLDLYINGKKLDKEDVTVYTDRLVRIKNTTLPFRDVMLFTRLSVGLTPFIPYMAQYAVSGNEFDTYIKTFCKDVIFDGVTTELDSASPSINDVFESTITGDNVPLWIQGEDTNTPLDIVEIPKGEEIIRTIPFMDRLTQDYNSDTNKMSKYFDSNVLKIILSDDYRILIEQYYKDTHQIIFDANAFEYMPQDFIFDPNKYYRNSYELIRLLSNLFKIGRITDMDSNEKMLHYKTPVLERFLYPDDVIAFDSNAGLETETFPKDIVLDSNILYNMGEINHA